MSDLPREVEEALGHIDKYANCYPGEDGDCDGCLTGPSCRDTYDSAMSTLRSFLASLTEAKEQAEEAVKVLAKECAGYADMGRFNAAYFERAAYEQASREHKAHETEEEL